MNLCIYILCMLLSVDSDHSASSSEDALYIRHIECLGHIFWGLKWENRYFDCRHLEQRKFTCALFENFLANIAFCHWNCESCSFSLSSFSVTACELSYVSHRFLRKSAVQSVIILWRRRNWTYINAVCSMWKETQRIMNVGIQMRRKLCNEYIFCIYAEAEEEERRFVQNRYQITQQLQRIVWDGFECHFH